MWRYQTELGSACLPCNKASLQTRLRQRKVQRLFAESSKEYREPVFKRPILPGGFQGRDFKGKSAVRAAGHVTFFWLVGVAGICHQPSGSKQCEVSMPLLSLKVPSSPWVEALVPTEEHKDMNQVVISLEEELGLYFIATLFFFVVDSYSSVSAFFHFPS